MKIFEEEKLQIEIEVNKESITKNLNDLIEECYLEKNDEEAKASTIAKI